MHVQFRTSETIHMGFKNWTDFGNIKERYNGSPYISWNWVFREKKIIQLSFFAPGKQS